MDGVRRVHVFVSGLVQGVWYRLGTEREAQRLGLAGWVRNLSDGGVEFTAQGAPDDVERLLAWARRGPPDARVDRLEVTEGPPEAMSEEFVVRR